MGGKDVIPLWRNASSTDPNVTAGLLEILSGTYEAEVVIEDLFAYAYAILANPGYVESFWEELSTPGPRVPITKNTELFHNAVELGQRLVWLHTFGERFSPNGEAAQVPQGTARCLQAVGGEPGDYPEDFSYDPVAQETTVGNGRFGPVSEALWEFEVSGLKVVQSWLSYRKKEGFGRRSSPLDEIRPTRWTPQMTDEFLELLWILEHTVEMRAELDQLLENIGAGECFAADELPTPTDDERASPRTDAPEDDAGQRQMDV